MAEEPNKPLHSMSGAGATMVSISAENNGLETQPNTGSAFGQLQSSLTNLRDDMQRQNKVLLGLQDQLYLKTEEVVTCTLKSKGSNLKSLEDKDMDTSEKTEELRHELLKKNLEIKRLEEVLHQTGSSHTALSSCPPASSVWSGPHHNIPPVMSIPADILNLKEKHNVQFEEKNIDVNGDTYRDAAAHRSEVEDLNLKLKTATQICVQQEKHFSNLVMELEHRLCEALAGRDELLTLRQQESGTQQQLIQQLQAALQQTKQLLEMKGEELSDCHNKMNNDQEKLTRAHTVLVKVQNIVKSEEVKRGRTNMLTAVTGDFDRPHAGDLLIQVLSNCLREDDTQITELVMKCQEMERQLIELAESAEAEKVKLLSDYQRKISQLETDHAKALDIAASRTLTERDRIAELLRQIDEDRQQHEKTVTDLEKTIVTLQEKNKACCIELEENSKSREIQHAKDVALLEQMEKRVKILQKEKEEMLKSMMLKVSSETKAVEKIATLEGQLIEAVQKATTAEQNYRGDEKKYLDDISRLKQELEAKDEEIQRIVNEHKEKLKHKTDKLLTREREENCQRYKVLEDRHQKSIEQISSLKDELRNKSNEIVKCMEECRTLKDKEKSLCKERGGILVEKQNLLVQCETLSEQILHLQEEKSTLSGMIRDNVQDLSRAKNMIDNLKVKLDERERNLEDFNRQDADLAELLMKKHLVGESLLHEHQQIVGIVEEKVNEIDELKGIRDALAHKLESKIQILNEVESTCRSLETKLEVRSNELDVIMEDRNKVVNDLKTREFELAKMKEERDSLVTLMNGKQSEKEREVNKLISRLKDSQHDLALTKKVLEAKREASGKAIKMATMTQEEITKKRKEVDALKDRITWLQESLQATTEEKAYFETKASELANELQKTNIEKEALEVELAQLKKNCDDSSGQVSQMEKALEKAGIKFAESQALVERLEQDLAKIKLQYSLEVKELQRKVSSVPEKELNVQVVQPFRLKKVSSDFQRENTLRTTKEHNATQQRLINEAEMTKSFKLLLNDLHQLMSDIKDSGGLLKKRNNVVERSSCTFDIDGQTGSDREKAVSDHQHPDNESNRSFVNKDIDVFTNAKPKKNLEESPNISSQENYQEKETEPESDRERKSAKVKAPLRSSSPKCVKNYVDCGKKGDTVSELSISDISDVESECPEVTPTHFVKGQRRLALQRRENKIDDHKSVARMTKLHHKPNTCQDAQETNADDVESLLMTQEFHRGSHTRAQKILDLLTLKGQKLTVGNQISQPLCGPSSEKYYLTISVIVKNRAHCIAEWIEFHLMNGVQHIYLYDNESTDNLQEVLSPYVKSNLVTVTLFLKQYVVLIDGSKEIMTQKLFLRNSIEKYACETRWMAMIDCDEFILPAGSTSVNNNSLVTVLKRYESFTSVIIPWLYFTSNGWITKPNKLVIEAYTRRWKKPKHTWKHILQPKRIHRVYSVHNFRSIAGYHSVNERMEAFANWPGMLNGHLTRQLYYSDSFYPYSVIKLHHYKTKSAEEWESRLSTGEVSGTDTDLTGPMIKKHWETFFKLQNVESETDTSMMIYLNPLRKKLRERFTNESYQPSI